MTLFSFLKRKNGKKIPEGVVKELKQLEGELIKAEKNGRIREVDKLCQQIADFKLKHGFLD